MVTANSIEATFRPAFEEISRRSAAAQTFQSVEHETTYFDRTATIPFVVPDQKFVLATIGSSVLAPRTKDAEHPAVRVYGAFPTREDAVEHMHVVQQLDAACSMVILQQNKWCLIPQNESVRDDPVANAHRRDRILAEYRERQENEARAFDMCVKAKVERPPPKITEEAEDKEEMDEAEALVYKPPKRLRAGGEVRGQTCVALSVVPHEFGECLLKIYGCFENTHFAEEWIQNAGSRHETLDDICVTGTCDYFYPNSTTKGKTHYRIKELQTIMNAAERNPEAVRSYKAWKREQEARSAAVDADIAEAATEASTSEPAETST
jgi:hypothetical protein